MGDQRSEAAPRPARRPSEFTRFVVVDAEGRAFEVTGEDYAECPALSAGGRSELLKRFVGNELGHKPSPGAPPPHIAYMRGHELVDYCDVSEKGHYKWYPKGLLIRRLILDYGAQLAREWGAFEMTNPLLIRGDCNVVGELMGEFHERDYRVDGGRGTCYLRYASDPLAFPFMQGVRFSHKQTPLKVFEEALCFRNEQEGEVSGLKRVRSFTMTDMHAACSGEEEARREFEWLCSRFAGLMGDTVAADRWVLGWEGTIEFFERNREWLTGIGAGLGVPAFFKLMPAMSHYFAMKNEFQAITADGGNIQVSTVQWDVKDGERFDIGYIDAEGKKRPCPVILHASSFGSVERTLCAILENLAVSAERGVAPAFPLWLSPTQVRILPVSDRHLAAALDACARLTRSGVRVDVDDRSESVGRRVRDGEREWTPFIAAIGDREVSSNSLSVRDRSSGEQRPMTVDALAETVGSATAGMPFRPLPLNPRLSSVG